MRSTGLNVCGSLGAWGVVHFDTDPQCTSRYSNILRMPMSTISWHAKSRASQGCHCSSAEKRASNLHKLRGLPRPDIPCNTIETTESACVSTNGLLPFPTMLPLRRRKVHYRVKSTVSNLPGLTEICTELVIYYLNGDNLPLDGRESVIHYWGAMV